MVKGVPEYLVNGIIFFYKGCKTAISFDGELKFIFYESWCPSSWSALSPLLCIMVMDALTEDVRVGSLMLKADDFVLCGKSLN